MFDAVTAELLVEALRILFLLAVPVVIVTALAGTIISALQSATTIDEPALSYAIRLLAVIILFYFMFPVFSRSLVILSELAWTP